MYETDYTLKLSNQYILLATAYTVDRRPPAKAGKNRSA